MSRKKPSPVETYRHKNESRPNLPTEQTSRYMSDEDREPIDYKPPIRSRQGPVLSWDRDDTLDDVTTQATPLYIHDKIHPSAFAESLQIRASQSKSLFHDFNNLPENAAFEWYKYRGNWQNRIIRGESRHLMASLLEKENMAGKVQMIYFDPPYGIKFKSNMQASIDNRNVGEQGKDIPNDPTIVQAFRDTYKNGIHSYLDNIYRIAVYARELLRESGSLFLQIGPANVHNLAKVLDEVFGAENRIATIPFAKSGSDASNTLPEIADYLLWYAKDRRSLKYRHLYEPLNRSEKIEHMASYAMVELADGTSKSLTSDERRDPDMHLPEGARLYRRMPLTSQGSSDTERSKPYKWNGLTFSCPPGEQWRVSIKGLDRLAELGRLGAANDQGMLMWKRYENEVPGRRINNLWQRQMSPSDMHYVVETAESVIERCILMTTDPGDLVFDPTCGSGTTAYTSEKWGRRWITSDVSTVAVSLARQRLVTGVFDYFLLLDSAEGAAKEVLERRKLKREKDNQHPIEIKGKSDYGHDPAEGFVYERVSTVSAAILAYDKDEPPTLLVNRPFRKSATIRVSSPFTVESHSPYRFVNPESTLRSEDGKNLRKAIIEALSVSGIKDGTTRISIEEIVEYPSDTESKSSSLITHLGNTEKGRSAIVICPDDCTVPSELINLAAEQAASMPSVTILIVIAFAFEADARGRTEKRGRLIIHKVQANQDIRIGNLADDRADHAFVRIGEPEILIMPNPDNPQEIIAEVIGYDTYDPSTGQIGSGEVKDIHCWMIDTQYDGRSFFAHRIHFPSRESDRQIKKFKRKLGKRVDPSLWERMLSPRSAPFARPKTGRIAVRIVTNTHTEMTAVLKIPNELEEIL